MSGEPSAWTTGQAALALISLGASWKLVRPSVDWLLAMQGPNGGWNFCGTHDGHERLTYTLYPTLALLRCRTHIGEAGKKALSRVYDFVQSSEEQQDPFWIPLRNPSALFCDLGVENKTRAILPWMTIGNFLKKIGPSNGSPRTGTQVGSP
jgi:hypothetical protein